MSNRNSRNAARRGGSLTLHILAVNVIAPLVLMVGLLYMDQYRESLIRAEIETMKTQARILAAAFAEGGFDAGSMERMAGQLGAATDKRLQVFSGAGALMADSGKVVEKTTTPQPEPGNALARVLHNTGEWLGERVPNKKYLKTWPGGEFKTVENYPDALAARKGEASATAWQTERGEIILTAAAPIQKDAQTPGIVFLTRDGQHIAAAMSRLRFDVLTVFLGALSLTVFMSLYLAAVIGGPLKKLAHAAESVRLERGKKIEIPDLSYRRDEVGELSEALRNMTQALQERMDTIDRFAADVAHELKNPLTSLRSAVETAALVKNPEDRERMMAIIKHDVQRMDRLITDISNASRLDAELSREERKPVDLSRLLQYLAGTQGREGKVSIDLPAPGPVIVQGMETRLAQVFENLISNALSFSPDRGRVTVRAVSRKENVDVFVEDQGPGIPEGKLDTIFERFYTERPKHEDYGRHSGLGLSIARQIVKAHDGSISAENIRDENGNVRGARFVVTLNAA